MKNITIYRGHSVPPLDKNVGLWSVEEREINREDIMKPLPWINMMDQLVQGVHTSQHDCSVSKLGKWCNTRDNIKLMTHQRTS